MDPIRVSECRRDHGHHRAISSLSFVAISFLGGVLEGMSADAMIIAAFILMVLGSLVFNRPISTTTQPWQRS